MSESQKPRVRMNTAGLVTAVNGRRVGTQDSFQNFAANIGLGTGNLSSGANYGFNPISRNHTLLEWMYRGSWLVRKIVDVVAEDMTRARIDVTSEESPTNLQELDQYWNRLLVWKRLAQTIKWARLYGGALAVIMIEGQDPSQPFQVESVGKDQFKGLLVLDRWMVWPDLTNPVTDFGVDFGTPKFYTTNSDARSIPTMKIHHSRCIRIDGVELPYWQRIAENDWGLSVIEPLYDRMVAFDSTTQGVAQLVYKAHLRTYYVDRLRETIAAGGKSYNALVNQVNMIRLMQTNEGMSLFDATDRFEAHTYSFAGLSDVLVQFAQQLSGAADIPLTRLFGQAPAGLNATGEADLRNYWDMINSLQEDRLRRGVETLRSVTYRSRFGKAPEKGETFGFTSLYKMTDAEKATTGSTVVSALVAGFEGQIMTREAAMKDLKQFAKVTGIGSNITDREIEAASEDDAPSLADLTGNILDNPIDAIRFGHGLPLGSGDDTDAHAQVGEQQVAGGEEDGQGMGTGGAPERGVEPAPGNVVDPDAGKIVGDSAEWVRRWFEGSRERTRATQDRRSVIDVHGLTVVVETAKGEARAGRGWRVSMPAHYGYFSGTGSAEGADEQMDCYVGDNPASRRVFVIYQVDPQTGEFDEHKVMLGFDTEDDAVGTYGLAFSDGTGPARVGRVEPMTVTGLKRWLAEWSYGLPGKVREDPLPQS